MGITSGNQLAIFYRLKTCYKVACSSNIDTLFVGIFKVSGFENTSEEDYINSYKVNAVGPALVSKVSLTILAIHGAKITKKQTPLVCFVCLFYNQTVYQKSVIQILERWSGCKIIKQNIPGVSDF